MYMCIYVYTYMYTSMFIYTHDACIVFDITSRTLYRHKLYSQTIYACMTQAFTCVYTYIYIYIYIWLYIRVYIYIYIYIWAYRGKVGVI